MGISPHRLESRLLGNTRSQRQVLRTPDTCQGRRRRNILEQEVKPRLERPNPGYGTLHHRCGQLAALYGGEDMGVSLLLALPLMADEQQVNPST
jgi:hypothetical protein